ncbi:MAG: hypothetical protein ABIR70_15855 [Bryobacteraceae bacterium]
MAIVLLAQSVGHSQPSSTQVEIYSVALIEAATAMHEQWQRYGVSHEFVVDLDGSPPASYPQAARGNIFKTMGYADLRKAASKAKDGIWVLRATPATVNGPLIQISVMRERVTVTRGGTRRGISEWAVVSFRLDDEGKNFRFNSVELGGI